MDPSSAPCCGRWTADGKFFLFQMDGQIWAHDERRDFFRQPPSEPVQLTKGPTRCDAPFPSKEGGRIFAQGATPHGELTRFDSKTELLLPFLGGISAQFVAFSSDGLSVAYVTHPAAGIFVAESRLVYL